MSFLVKDDNLLDRYNEILSTIKKTLNMKFHSMHVYDEKYIKVKLREFNGAIKTKFLGDQIPKENVHYDCIVCISIDSVMKKRKKKKNYPSVYLEERKYKIKKIKMTEFINTKAESESQSEPDLESDLKLESKLKLESDSEKL